VIIACILALPFWILTGENLAEITVYIIGDICNKLLPI
jgi:hypothetical protein